MHAVEEHAVEPLLREVAPVGGVGELDREVLQADVLDGRGGALDLGFPFEPDVQAERPLQGQAIPGNRLDA